MLKYIYFIFIFFTVILSYSQCPIGDVYLSSQEDVENYISNYADCEVITGTLYIGDATDISGITGIKRIEGSLRISYSKINSVLNFSNLEYVGGDFVIDNSHLIEAIEGIDKLHTVNGNFLIGENHSIQQIKGFNSLVNVNREFAINQNSSLEIVSGFEKLNEVFDFQISNNASLISIPEFNQLVSVGWDLDISGNAVLPEIKGFNSLTEIVLAMNIARNSSLATIDGFENLYKLSSLNIFQSPITSLSSFNALVSVTSIYIYESKLSNINGFNNIEVMQGDDPNIGILYIYNNNELLEISGFKNLTIIEGQLSIINNSNLVSLIGFNYLIKAKQININTNESLTNLRGLENLFVIENLGGTSLIINNNTNLSDCSVLCNLLSYGIIDGLVIIQDNPSKCSSESQVRSECLPDFDKDGILDDDDLDDDNDGILDTVEQNGDPNRDTDSDGYPDHQDLDSDGDGCFDVIEAGFTDGDGNGTLGSSPDTVDSNGLIVGAEDGYTTPLDTDGNNVFDFQEFNTLNAGLDGRIELCTNSISIDLFNSLGGTPDVGGVWSPSLASGTGVFDPSIDNPGIYTYTVMNNVCGSETSQVEVIVNQLPDAGEDGRLEICESSNTINLYESLGGTPDIGGTWSPSLTSGTGIFDPSIDAAGIYTYTVTNGACGSDTSQVEVVVGQVPNAGLNTNVEICVNSIPINLFDSLGGTPDSGGVWSPSLASGTGVFNPSIDNPGIYTYTVSNGICGSNTSEVNVHVYQIPDAGLNASLEICENTAPFNLFDILGGTPHMDGVWLPVLASGTNVFNPAVDPSGIYTYTVTNGVCGSDTSQVEIVVNQIPNAGLDGTLEICVNSNPMDLFGGLNGIPNRGGIWSPSLASGTGVFDPRVDEPGTYTYVIDNGVCGLDTSQVIVSVVNATPIQDYTVKASEFNDDNMIEIVINSNSSYEYSLDNVNFQSSPVFSNLSGGDYIVYAKEVRGCGILEVPVSILDYPKFFTPNSDGINDTWKLKGRTAQDYSIYIYDRYGKLLKHLVSYESGWDGTFNGKALPSNDYWFKIVFNDGTIKKGHFTLKR